MRASVLYTAFTVSAITLLAIACNNSSKETAAETPTFDSASLVKRGEYLVAVSGCDDCHSPKAMGPNGPELVQELRLSGYPSTRPIQEIDKENLKKGWALFGPDLTNAVGPWGMSFAANITSDATGIGNWTEAQFFTAIRKGKYKGQETGRPLLPPMPWVNYKNMSDEDLRAVFYYLQTTKPVENVVPAPKAPTEL